MKEQKLSAKRREFIREMILKANGVPVPRETIIEAVVDSGLGIDKNPDHYASENLSYDINVILEKYGDEFKSTTDGFTTDMDYKHKRKQYGAYERKLINKQMKEAKIVEKHKTLSEIEAEARKLGLSYGKYLVRVSAEKERLNHGKQTAETE